jgi:5-methylcytosine-specific restriction endonuclease McrA
MHWRRKARADGREAGPAWSEARKANYHKRRAQKLGTQVEELRPIDIYERDIWLCGLCSTPVDPDCTWPDPMSPSLDHIKPLSLGGTHTYENVQLAHLVCNVSKGNRVAA